MSIQYRVCVYANPNNIGAYFLLGGVQAKDGQVLPIAPGQTYTLQAVPPSGYQFKNWGTARSVTVADLNAAQTTVTFGTAGWDGTCVGNLTANYYVPAPSIQITIGTQGQGQICVSAPSIAGSPVCVSAGGSQTVSAAAGDNVTFRATPTSGWNFVGFVLSTNPGVRIINNPYTTNQITSNVTVTALFEQPTYTITVHTQDQASSPIQGATVNLT